VRPTARPTTPAPTTIQSAVSIERYPLFIYLFIYAGAAKAPLDG
jgi:hypothetical protein